jgi:hypothetical protein
MAASVAITAHRPVRRSCSVVFPSPAAPSAQHTYEFEIAEMFDFVEADFLRRLGEVDDGEKQAVLGGADVLREVVPRHPPVADRERIRSLRS